MFDSRESRAWKDKHISGLVECCEPMSVLQMEIKLYDWDWRENKNKELQSYRCYSWRDYVVNGVWGQNDHFSKIK